MRIVLGAGISGISCSYHLAQKGIENIVFEKDDDWGGLCGNFEIEGFRFDKAIHLSFTNNENVKELFAKSCEYIIHNPLAYNYYKGSWLKHPAQNNLEPLSLTEKIEIISDFVENPNQKENIKNYEEWLKAQYGNYFSENFPLPYTRKYWTLEAKDLSDTWVGNRMYQPNIKEVLKGAFEKKTPNTYYASEMRYPLKGGYKSFLNYMRKDCDIRLNKKVIEIDTINKIVYFEDNTNHNYDDLISSIPLPEYKNLIKDMPIEVKNACEKLKYTSVALVSIGLNKLDIPKYLWFYIYDEDILASRCYSPSIKSSDNVPKECSSFQFEIYFSKDKPLNLSNDELINHIIEKSEKMNVFNKEYVVVKDCRVLEYGNVIFYHGMEDDRKIILNYLENLNIKTVGRFGKWEYLWSDQSLMSGEIV
ncbi:protoporphyrinogen/coproporphyrinogen oxidase [Aliarcobacter butzleri]|uniref:protoporphyrinogen/coproporphyrinogen oxidase n=1 Tax=Aliarcobacter butzleri TaxID=28197 RepID=UPI0012F8ACE3|nr:FAD-dependent oxidoreductase [Aliarcobacter butzleri]